MDAVFLLVFMKVSSQMAAVSFAKTQEPSLYGLFHFHAYLWSQVLCWYVPGFIPLSP
jgi:hypothetical protein